MQTAVDVADAVVLVVVELMLVVLVTVVLVLLGLVLVVLVLVGLVLVVLVLAVLVVVAVVVLVAVGVVVVVVVPEETVIAGVEVGVIGTVPSDGVATHVVTWIPAVREFRPSGWSGSGEASGTVPT